jgi:DNA-binding transcriptional LysR family regulator
MVDEDVRTFLAIAKHGDVAAAGRALGISQSTMESRLAEFLADRGRRLLERTPCGYALTTAGEAMLAHFEWIKTEVLAVDRTLST